MTTLRTRLLTPIDATCARYLDDAVVVIAGGRIEHVGPYDGRRVDEDLRPGVMLPGFVDSHVHYPQTRIVGSASGPLLQWLERSTFPEEARFADPAHARQIAETFATALASAGTTLAFVYGPVFPAASEVLLEVLERRGMRAVVGPVLMDAHSPDALSLPPDEALPALDALASRWHGRDSGRLQVAAIPRFALSCSEAMLRGAAEVADARGLWVSTHLSESPEECRVACERFGARDYLRIYERAGLVHDRSLFAHCIHLSADEWGRMADAGAVVAHCPDSNDFLGSGGMPVGTVLEHEIPLSIGTDVAAGRSFRVPRILASAYDNGLRQGVTLDPRTLLWWGTRGGALALGHAGVGAVEPGMEADLVLLDLPPWAESEDDVLAWALFHHDAPPPRRTWIRGRVVWERTWSPWFAQLDGSDDAR